MSIYLDLMRKLKIYEDKLRKASSDCEKEVWQKAVDRTVARLVDIRKDEEKFITGEFREVVKELEIINRPRIRRNQIENEVYRVINNTLAEIDGFIKIKKEYAK